MSRVYIGIGSNLGNRLSYLRSCVTELENAERVTVTDVSSAYLSKPIGNTDQPDFLNGVIAVETEIAPSEFLGLLNMIEDKYGRERSIHWGPRTLDVDILLYDDEVVDDPDLKIPHPLLTERRFVLEPLLEIAPGISLPDGSPLKNIAEALGEDQGVWRIGKI